MDELFRFASWTRELARGVVGDDAEDVVQETWISALRRPPDTSKPVRPWLGTVARRHAFNQLRGSSRRAAREGRVELGASSSSAEELLGRLETHKLLVEAVEKLPEPYRRTVLLAYFEGLTSAQISERENVPPGTVRGRLKTALELLRESLDARFGTRGLWLAPLTVLANPPNVAAGVATSTSVATSTGVALKTFVGVLSVLATGTAAWTVAGPAPRPAIAAEAPRLDPPSEHGRGVAVGAASPVAPTPVEALSAATEHVEALKILIHASLQRAAARRSALPPLPRSTISPPPGRPSVSNSPAAAVSPSGDGCVIATKGDGPVVKACAKGGRPEAKRLMKAMVKDAKARGARFTCDGCHADLDGYALTTQARDDYAKLAALLAKQP